HDYARHPACGAGARHQLSDVDVAVQVGGAGAGSPDPPCFVDHDDGLRVPRGEDGALHRGPAGRVPGVLAEPVELLQARFGARDELRAGVPELITVDGEVAALAPLRAGVPDGPFADAPGR